MPGSVSEGLVALVDWFNCVFEAEKVERVQVLVSKYLGEASSAHPRHTYRDAVAWEGGAGLYWSEKRPDAMLSVNGGSIRSMGQDAAHQLIHDLQELGVSWTRLDATVDDMLRRVDVWTVVDAAREGNYAQYKNFAVYDERTRHRGRVVPKGTSIRFGEIGREGSGVSAMIYDKALESKGENPAIRWEVRYSKDAANMAVLVLLQDGRGELEKYARRVTGLVRAALAFPDRSTGDRLSRMDPLPWWDKFRQLLDDGARIRVDREVPVLQRTLHAFALQYGAVIGQMVELHGADFADHLIAECWKARHRVKLARYGGDVTLDVGAAFAKR